MKRLALIALLAALLPASAGGATTAAFNADPIFPVGPISDSTSHQILKLDEVAEKLSGRANVVVNCWSEKDWSKFQAWQSAHHAYALVEAAGVTWERTRDIELAPYACEVLGQVIARSANQPLFTASAVTLLAHESSHAAGIRAENKAECRA